MLFVEFIVSSAIKRFVIC